MNKKLLGFLGVFVLGLLSFFLLFGGIGGFTAWYKTISNDATWVPFNNYNNRIVNASKLTLLDATHVVFEDQSLFWKGQKAAAVPKFNDEGELEQLEITSGGSGYGALVTARITGAGASQFELGEVTVRDGEVFAIKILKTGEWYDSPRTFFEGDKLPFSGTAEIKYRKGQLFERRQYLSGELHGKWSKWKSNGIPTFEKDYVRGLKHGTHMYWYGEPIDPRDYKSSKEDDPEQKNKTYVSLWVEVNQKVKEKFKGKHPSQQEWNDWVVTTYKGKGGSFGPELLEHYENNKRHGLFEKYDDSGNKIFKDEYEFGKLIKHKAFDPGKSS